MKTMQRMALVGAVAVGALGCAVSAQARDKLHWSVEVGNAPPIYHAPPPVYVQPRPVYVHPRPIYAPPPAYYYGAPPVAYRPPPGYYFRSAKEERRWRRHMRRVHRDWDDDDD